MARITDSGSILAAQDLPYEDVACPEWGGDVCVQALSGKERDQFEASTLRLGAKNGKLSGKLNLRNTRARLVALAARQGPGGARLFTPEQVEALGEKNGAVLDRLFQVAQRLAGLTPGDMEELTASFLADQNADSILSLP